MSTVLVHSRLLARTVSISLLKSPGVSRSLYSSPIVLSSKKSGPTSPPTPLGLLDPDQRLVHLKSGEKLVAIFAGVSILACYIGLKLVQYNRGMATEAGKGSSQAKLPVLVVAGPSGSGKSTLLKKLFKQYPDKLAFSVSHTTRRPRPGEIDGKDYHFSTREKMQEAIDAKGFIEWAEYSGNLYGTSIKSVMECQQQGKVCVLDIDMQGVRSIKLTDLKAVYVHIKPPSLEVLEERLRARQTDTEEALRKRLKMAKEELEYAATPGAFNHIVVNDTVERAYADLDTVINEKIGLTK